MVNVDPLANAINTQYIQREVIDHILIITLNRPDKRNAFNFTMAEELEQAVDFFESSSDLWVAIIKGTGKIFCAGLDISPESVSKPAITEKRGTFGIFSMPPDKPLIAAVHGQVLGGGLELALCCDLIVADHDTTFGLPEVKRGLLAAGGGCFRLPRRLSYQTAMEMLLTGSSIGVDRMYACGLVNRVAEVGHAVEEALKLALKICENAPLSVKASKQIARASVDESWSDEEAWDKQMPYVLPAVESEDTQEGLKAFSEKRSPNWRAR